MQEELARIDTSPLDTLVRIKQELDTLVARLAAMEAKRDGVAAPVYARVRDDYEQRQRALEDEAAPLKATARSSYAQLRELLRRSEEDHEGTRLDREEVDFRFSLGEFDEADYRTRLAEVDRRLAEKAAAREAADALRQRFVAAFASEEDLEHAPARARADAATVQLHTLDPERLGATPADAVPPPPPASDAPTKPGRKLAADATQVMRVLGRGDTAGPPPRSDQTLVMRTARLLPQNRDAGTAAVVLGLKPMLFGSGKDCDVKLAGASARHAEIRASMAGFTITDHGGGVRINGVALEQHLLRQDDAVDIGNALYVFRET